MACPAVGTGERFLVETLAHLDCQAQTLGSFGFQTLAQPDSPAAIVLAALLTLFVAVYGIRMLFGQTDEPRDIVGSVLKVGIVLTLAVSWPAWRTLAYDTVLLGPAELASTIMPSTLPDPRSGFPQRLQNIDTGIATVTAWGTGRQTGEILPNEAGGFRSIALEDEAGLGWARPLFLAATIGPLAAVRLTAGLLLALAPIMAGLLLFDMSRGLFVGWMRGLVLCALGSLGITVMLSTQVALMEPLLTDVITRRELGYATPTAPTELLGLVLAFALAAAGLMVILVRMAFHDSWPLYRHSADRRHADRGDLQTLPSRNLTLNEVPVRSRAISISEGVAMQIRHEQNSEAGPGGRRQTGVGNLTGPSAPVPGREGSIAEPLGSSNRRNVHRETRSQRTRDESR